jgi:transcription initiation factor TFIIIB Brf1 subunit/transcription initiation factor TFIIB
MHDCIIFNKINTIEGVVCDKCGLMLCTINIDSRPVFGTFTESIVSKQDQKTIALNNYIKTIFTRLDLPLVIYNSTCNIAFELITKMYTFTKYKGIYLKQAIIIISTCDLFNVYNYKYLATKLNLNVKYILKAKNVISDLVCNKHFIKINDTIDPMNIIYSIIHKSNLEIPEYILSTTNKLVKEFPVSCHQPSSIAISCLYHVICKFNIDIDIKLFSTIYNLSESTIIKVISKIK